jgi:hypothetical protein
VKTNFNQKGLHCQETNQEFVPFPKQAQKIQSATDEIGEDADSDRMSDLFPGIYLQKNYFNLNALDFNFNAFIQRKCSI